MVRHGVGRRTARLARRCAAALLTGLGSLGWSAAEGDDFVRTPAASEPALVVADDLELDLLLQEPRVANPLHLTFDERGRLWVTQYRQYPWPAGLKLLSRDSVYRNRYDPPFAPPPPHATDSPFRGRDRITIHEDVDGDGRYDLHRTFVDGLNLATAALPGRGGVFVMNPPYLLFYADRNRDDVPDDPQPEILLEGFGFEDSHSLANSLRWGPDGWIYGAQGSTVSSAVLHRGADGAVRSDAPPVRSMGQNIWRYHPERRIYEVYAEGGGNAFGVEIDGAGRVYSGHNGGDTRGFHYIQGGYYQKTFGKHGQLSNRYAFAYHEAMRGTPTQRFTHSFCIYEGLGLPSRYQGLLLSINPIAHQVLASRISPLGATRQTEDLGVVVSSAGEQPGEWFIPVDIQLGPDGAVYLADWHAQQANHYRGHEGLTNPELGRVYRLRGRTAGPQPVGDLSALSSSELAELAVTSPQRWLRHTAIRLLGDRRDGSVVAVLVERLAAPEPAALDALWALNASAELTASHLQAAAEHPQPDVRRWAWHLLGDRPELAGRLAAYLSERVRLESAVSVRCQIAATARRLPARTAIPLLTQLMSRAEDADDPFVPKAVWWSLEAHAEDWDALQPLLDAGTWWNCSWRVGGYRLPQNLLRRYAQAGKQSNLLRCAALLEAAPTPAVRDELVAAFAGAFAGRALPPLPAELSTALADAGGTYALLLGVRRRDASLYAAALERLVADESPLEERLSLLQALADVQAEPARTLPALFAILEREDGSVELKLAVLTAVGVFREPEIGDRLLTLLDELPEACRSVAVAVLASRAQWASALVDAVAEGAVDAASVDADAVARMKRFPDAELRVRLSELFPAGTSAVSDLEAAIESVGEIVRGGQGDPLRGRELFHGKAACGKCHRVFEQGGQIGPDLTSYDRSDLPRMLLAVIHPSAEIREGYEVSTAVTADGRVLAGFKLEANDDLLMLRAADGSTHTLAMEDVEELAPTNASLMPEGLLDGLSEAELRDLFAFLSSTTPPM